MRRYAGIIKNDVVNGNGICVSFFVQGCPIHCEGCHNANDWSFNAGYELPEDYLSMIDKAIIANNIERNFSLLGGEPLCNENLDLSLEILSYVRRNHPGIDICVWSGYCYEDLISRNDPRIKSIFEIADVLIDGPFRIDKRNIALKMRGSDNQRLIDLNQSDKNNIVLKSYSY